MTSHAPRATTLEDVRTKLPASSDASVLYAGEDHVAGLVGPVLVVLARGEPGEEILTQAPRWIDRLLTRYPQKGAYMVVIQTSAKPPGDVGRKRIDRAYTEYGRGVHAGAIVIEGKGFMAASIRSALSVIMLASRYPYPQKTFATVGEAAPFLSGKLPAAHPFTAAQLVAGVEDLRAAYEAHVGVFTAGTRSV
jgi:hypothetical protein